METKVSGLTQSETARRLKITRNTLVNWTERGLINTAHTWTSPGGKRYVGYSEAVVEQFCKDMGLT